MCTLLLQAASQKALEALGRQYVFLVNDSKPYPIERTQSAEQMWLTYRSEKKKVQKSVWTLSSVLLLCVVLLVSNNLNTPVGLAVLAIVSVINLVAAYYLYRVLTERARMSEAQRFEYQIGIEWDFIRKRLLSQPPYIAVRTACVDQKTPDTLVYGCSSLLLSLRQEFIRHADVDLEEVLEGDVTHPYGEDYA